MKIKHLTGAVFITLGFYITVGQQRPLGIDQAIELALSHSEQSKIADTKINTAGFALKSTKSHRYPDLDLSGQYLRLTQSNADIKLGSSTEEQSTASNPDIGYIMIGRATASIPIFSGFKINNRIKASKNKYEAAFFNAKNEKQQIALKTVVDYVNLYKADISVELIEENLQRAKRRVADFRAMEQNGLLARNDLLKAQLQQSNIELNLEQAKKNQKIANYTLVTLLHLPAQTMIQIQNTDFNNPGIIGINDSIKRSDLKALYFEKEAAKNQIKVARSNYYPSLALTGGYAALEVENVMTITNAMNFGLGVRYNLADIFKTGSEVKAAKSKVKELEYTMAMARDQITIQVQDASENYKLSLKQYQVYQKAQTQATENYRIVNDKYENGLVDTNDLLEADLDQLQAKINLAFAKADISQRYYELLNAKGLINTAIN